MKGAHIPPILPHKDANPIALFLLNKLKTNNYHTIEPSAQCLHTGRNLFQ